MEKFKEMWKQEIAHHTENPAEFNEKEFKTEEIQDEELEEDDSETDEEIQDEELNENNFESEDEIQLEDKMIHINAKQHNQDLRFKWYRRSIHAIPDKFKLQYVQANANKRNQETIFEWYKECEKIGLIPEEFKLVPEDTEIKETVKDQPRKKKSFHKRRK